MKIIYKMSVKSQEKKFNYSIESMKIDDVDINWNFTECKALKNITLEIKNNQLSIDSEGYIIFKNYKNIEKKIYKIALFIANNFFIQTGLDIIDSSSILNFSPELLPESKEEEEIFNKTPQKGFDSIVGGLLVIGRFDSNKCKKYECSAAISSYADGLRIENVLQKYEQFYKVIEHFFGEESDKLDQEVSTYASQFDKIYTKSKIRRLRRLRNWCTHPKDRHKHINSENIERVRKVYCELENMKKLAELLINNPKK